MHCTVYTFKNVIWNTKGLIFCQVRFCQKLGVPSCPFGFFNGSYALYYTYLKSWQSDLGLDCLQLLPLHPASWFHIMQVIQTLQSYHQRCLQNHRGVLKDMLSIIFTLLWLWYTQPAACTSSVYSVHIYLSAVIGADCRHVDILLACCFDIEQLIAAKYMCIFKEVAHKPVVLAASSFMSSSWCKFCGLHSLSRFVHTKVRKAAILYICRNGAFANHVQGSGQPIKQGSQDTKLCEVWAGTKIFSDGYLSWNKFYLFVNKQGCVPQRMLVTPAGTLQAFLGIEQSPQDQLLCQYVPAGHISLRHQKTKIWMVWIQSSSC